MSFPDELLARLLDSRWTGRESTANTPAWETTLNSSLASRRNLDYFEA